MAAARMPPSQNNRRPPRESFLQGKALTTELLRNPRSDLSTGESMDKKWVEKICQRYNPVPSGLCLPISHPIVGVMIDFVFSNQKYSKRGNLVMEGPTTLENFAHKVRDMARAARFPSAFEAEELFAAFDKESKTFLFADVLYSPYVDRVHRYLCEISREHELATFVMMTKNICPTDLCNVRIAASPKHGEGVFAQRNLKRGDLITLHPCHYVSINLVGHTAWVPAKVGIPNMTEMLSKVLFQYSAHVADTCISIAADPTIPPTPAACAHLINDGAVIEERDFDYATLQKYVADSTAAQNCHFVTLAGVCVAAVASRDIKRNEEVYAAYGGPFWASLLSQ
jgi:hypothetical protein